MTYRTVPVVEHRSVVDADTQLIDVRQPDEVAAGTLEGAVNIPLGQLIERIGELDPARRAVVVCRSGGRSTEAAEILTRAGFADVVNLDGGMIAYSKEHTS